VVDLSKIFIPADDVARERDEGTYYYSNLECCVAVSIQSE